MHVVVLCMRVVFLIRYMFECVLLFLCHGGSNVRYYFSDLCIVLLLSFSKAHQINTKTIDRFDCYPGQAKLHALNATICGFLCVLKQTH